MNPVPRQDRNSHHTTDQNKTLPVAQQSACGLAGQQSLKIQHRYSPKGAK